MQDPNFGKLTSMHFYAWKKGLKTGMYYLRSQAATAAIKFTLDKTGFETKTSNNTQQEVPLKTQKQQQDAIACSLDDPDNCEACGS